jgi:DNA modification methylase
MNDVLCADNMAVLANLTDGSIDLIYIDPPFATGSRRTGRRENIGFDDVLDCDEYVAWMRPRMKELHRVLKPTGSLFVHLDWRAVHYVKIELDRLFGFDRFVNEIVWCYSVGGKSRRSFGRKHDTILWYARSASYAFYPEAVRIARKSGSHMRVVVEEGRQVQVKRDAKTGRVYRYPVHEGKIPEDYWTDIETLNRSDRQRTGWPTQKPEALVARIITATTRPGDTVADFFCGSGTTAVVAHRLGRRFIAVDCSPEAIAITRARLAKAALNLQIP